MLSVDPGMLLHTWLQTALLYSARRTEAAGIFRHAVSKGWYLWEQLFPEIQTCQSHDNLSRAQVMTPTVIASVYYTDQLANAVVTGSRKEVGVHSTKEWNVTAV